VLTGLSDDEGFIQADLANYPQVRKALENGKTLRITTANGSGLLAAGKINNGEVLLRAIMDSFVPAKPMLNCP
jgi:phosphosulfolactate phosphohydrolase-like enzyme